MPDWIPKNLIYSHHTCTLLSWMSRTQNSCQKFGAADAGGAICFCAWWLDACSALSCCAQRTKQNATHVHGKGSKERERQGFLLMWDSLGTYQQLHDVPMRWLPFTLIWNIVMGSRMKGNTKISKSNNDLRMHEETEWMSPVVEQFASSVISFLVSRSLFGKGQISEMTCRISGHWEISGRLHWFVCFFTFAVPVLGCVERSIYEKNWSVLPSGDLLWTRWYHLLLAAFLRMSQGSPSLHEALFKIY